MTMIAATKNYNFPIIIGDLLISKKNGEKRFISPTSPFELNDHFDRNLLYKPDELFQKIYIVKENVAVALAGSLFEMVDFLSRLKQFCRCNEKITIDKIGEFISNYDLVNDYKESAYFISVIDNENETIATVKNYIYPESKWRFNVTEIFDGTFSIGTGADSFMNSINENQKLSTCFIKGSPEYAISNNYSLLAKLLVLEQLSLIPINENWGCGFETIFYNGKSFQKFENFAFLLFRCEVKNGASIHDLFPTKIMYYFYKDDVLYVSSVSLFESITKSDDDYISYNSNKNFLDLFVVPSIDLPHGSRIVPPEKFTFNTDKIACGFGFVRENLIELIPSAYSDYQHISIDFREADGLTIVVSKSLISQLLQSVSEILK